MSHPADDDFDQEFPCFSGVDFHFRASNDREILAPELFVNHIRGTAHCLMDWDIEIPMGELSFWCILESQAINCGFEPSEVCDAHSEFLLAAYRSVYRMDGDFRRSLGGHIEPAAGHLIVLDDFSFAADLRTTKAVVAAFETAINAFQSSGHTIACQSKPDGIYKGIDFKLEEWQGLGFVQIAGTQFLVRDSARYNPYDARKRKPSS